MVGKSVLALAFLAFSLSEAARAQTEFQIDEKTGLFKLKYQSVDIVKPVFGFWYGEWTWTGCDWRTKVIEKGKHYAFECTNGDMSMKTEAVRDSENSFTWTIDLREQEKGPKSLFGGAVFKFDTRPMNADGFNPVPKFKDDKTGLTLQITPDGPPFDVTFDRPITDGLYFEYGNTNEARAFLVSRNEQLDKIQIKMKVTFPGKVVPSMAESMAPRSGAWRQSDLRWDVSPVDLSFLNADEKPAGRRGFLRAVGEDLVFEDGTKARFWGTNITAYALFQTPADNACQAAKRLSALGFNLVRFTHHDSSWVEPNIFASRTDTLSLNAASLERLDQWIKCLKDEGIYVWLDLHVGREIMAKDGIEAFNEFAPGKEKADFRGYNYVNKSLQDRMREFAEAYVSHVNKLTGLAYKDEPAIMAVHITNENDVTFHFGNGLLPDKNVPWHAQRYLELAGNFATAHGLDFERVWRAWEDGPSKMFLGDLEHTFNVEMGGHLRGLGVKAPLISTSSWGEMGIAGLPSLASMDMVDVHSYGAANEVAYDPRYRAGMVEWLAAASVAGKPLSVSEWNLEPFPVFDRYQAPPRVAAIASLQAWDALLLYAYSQEPFVGPGSPGNWHAYNDPALIAMLPSAALMYRARQVSEGATTYYLDLPKDEFFGKGLSPNTSRALRTLAEKGKLRVAMPTTPELPWLKPTVAPEGAKIITDPDFDGTEGDASTMCSDTKQICRDWRRRVYQVNAPAAQVASGWLGGQVVELDNLTVALTTPNASVAAQSLDGVPLGESRRILLSLSAQCSPFVDGRVPYYCEPVEGTVKIRAKPGLKLSMIAGDGSKTPYPATAGDGGYEIVLTRDFKSSWAVLE